jgi:pimeloyl-ACP methyl ester carboxylesterase
MLRAATTPAVSPSIALHDLGGDGPAVVICHATGFCGRAYLPLATELLPHFHVWAVDLRGHGEAGIPPDGDFSYAAMARDLAAEMDAVAVDGIRIFGHSMGGAVGLLAARLRPDLVRSAYLFEPAVLPTETVLGARLAAFAETVRGRRDHFASRAEVLWSFSRRSPYQYFRADALAAFVEHGFEDLDDGTVRLRCRPESEALCYLGDNPRADEFRDLDLTVTFGCGGTDGFDTGMVPPAFAEQMPRAEVIVYERLGHFAPFEAPVTIAYDAVSAFAGGR